MTDNRCKIEGSEQYKLELAGRTISIANNQDRGFVLASEIPNLEISKTYEKRTKEGGLGGGENKTKK